MSKFRRGRILRDANAGEGLVSIEGQQYAFRLEGMWRSEFAPRVDGTVEAEFDEHGTLIGLRGLDAATVAGEHAAQALGVAQDAAKKLAHGFQSQGLPLIREYAQRIGYLKLSGIAVVILGWFFLPVLKMEMPFGGEISATFYQALKLSSNSATGSGLEGIVENLDRSGNLSGGSAGVLGMLCFIALAAVFLPQLWRDKRAAWGLFAPLAMTLLVSLVMYFRFSSAVSTGMDAAGDFAGEEFAAMAREMAAEAMTEIREAVSIGSGLWVSLSGTLLLAWRGLVTRTAAALD